MTGKVSNSTPIGHPHERLIELINPLIFSLGYRVIDLEIQTHRQKTLRIFIDHLDVEPSVSAGIGIEDCVRVTRALDEPLDQLPEVGTILNGSYELEVSSPGVNRALRTSGDFQKYFGSKVRIHVYRPLSAEELGNAKYQATNPRQKNFLGILSGFRESGVVLSLSLGEKKSKKNSHTGQQSGTKKGASLPTNSEEERIHAENTIVIPLPLISKANLEADFDFEGSNESE